MSTQNLTLSNDLLLSTHSDSTSALAIADNIYLSKDVSNAYMIRTSEGDILINAGTYLGKERNKKAFDSIDKAPADYRYIILTQHLSDHIGGTEAFVNTNTKIIANHRFARNSKKRASVQALVDQRAGKLWKPVFGDVSKLNGYGAISPDIEVENKYSFKLGNLAVDVHALLGDPTEDALLVHLPEENTVFCGNFFGYSWMSIQDLCPIQGYRVCSTQDFIESLRFIASLEPETLITSHGEPITGKLKIKNCLSNLEEAMQSVHDQTVEGMNAGIDLHTLMEEVSIPTSLNVDQLYGKVSWNVRSIWNEYIGWFDFESTTELYSKPQKSISSDLVELAGIEPLVERAELYLQRDKPLEAIHLMEIVLANSPLNLEGLTVMRDAHQLLFSKSNEQNVNETLWLHAQICNLNERISHAKHWQSQLKNKQP